jgi:uncharacterized protein YndB with AHSA1/START domain
MAEMKLIALAGKQEFTTTFEFDAPRDVVFRVYADPRLIPQWWGPRTLTTVVEKMDVRAGGSWRIIQRDANGAEHAFHGVYHEVAAPERIVGTFEYEGTPGHVMLETVSFEERGGRTVMTDLSVFQSVADRDAMVGAGMEQGAAESMHRLAELLAKPGVAR